MDNPEILESICRGVDAWQSIDDIKRFAKTIAETMRQDTLNKLPMDQDPVLLTALRDRLAELIIPGVHAAVQRENVSSVSKEYVTKINQISWSAMESKMETLEKTLDDKMERTETEICGRVFEITDNMAESTKMILRKELCEGMDSINGRLTDLVGQVKGLQRSNQRLRDQNQALEERILKLEQASNNALEFQDYMRSFFIQQSNG